MGKSKKLPEGRALNIPQTDQAQAASERGALTHKMRMNVEMRPEMTSGNIQ